TDGLDGGRARHVAEDADVADQGILTQGGDDQRTARRIDDHVGGAVDDDVGGIGGIALVKELLAGIEGDAFASERKQLELCRIDLREHRNPTEQFDVFVNSHLLSPACRYSAAMSSCSAVPGRASSAAAPC